MRAETAPDVMETVANSPSDRRQVGWQKDPQRSSVRNGSKLPYQQLLCVGAPCKDIIKARILDPGGEDNCSAAERSTGIASAGSRCWGGEYPHGPAAVAAELVRGRCDRLEPGIYPRP